MLAEALEALLVFILMKELGACLLDLASDIVIFPNIGASWYVTLEMKHG